MEYILQPGNNRYSLSYQRLKEDYWKYRLMSNSEFLKSLPEILHFACIVGWMKELGPDSTLSDEGIIHQLVHLLTGTTGPSVNMEDIREQFEELLNI